MFKVKMSGSILKEVVEKAVCNMDKKSCVPILQKVVLSVNDNTLSAYTSDAYNYLTITSNDVYECESGTIGIDVDDLKVLLKMSNDVIITELENEILVLNGKRSISLMKYNLDDFPKIPTDEFEDKLSLIEKDFSETLINLVTFTSDSESNQLMQCFNCNLTDGRFETLDGHRIGIKTILDSEKLVDSGSFLLNRCAVSSLKKTLNKKSTENIIISEGGKYVKVIGNNFTYIQRKTEGEYFKLNSMLPSNTKISFNVNTKEMMEIFKYYTENVIDKQSKTPVILKIDNQEIITYGRNTRFAASDSMEISDHNGNDLTIGFNPYFLVEALKVADTETVRVGGDNPKSPFIIYAGRYSFLVLPVNLSKDSIEEMETYLNKVNVA